MLAVTDEAGNVEWICAINEESWEEGTDFSAAVENNKGQEILCREATSGARQNFTALLAARARPPLYGASLSETSDLGELRLTRAGAISVLLDDGMGGDVNLSHVFERTVTVRAGETGVVNLRGR